MHGACGVSLGFDSHGCEARVFDRRKVRWIQFLTLFASLFAATVLQNIAFVPCQMGRLVERDTRIPRVLGMIPSVEVLKVCI